MPSISISGGGNYDQTVYGPATVIAGSGNDSITIIGAGEVSIGSGSDTIAVGTPVQDGAGRSIRGEGTRGAYESAGRALRGGSLQSAASATPSSGTVIVGSGSDSVTLYSGGQVVQNGLSGHDTINLGTGSDTIYEQGSATVYGTFSHGAFGSATISGGELKVIQSGGVTQDIAVNGLMTLVGSSAHTDFVGGTGSALMTGVSGYDTFVGGSGSDTMAAAGNHNVFQFLSSEQGGQHVISNFTSGDSLYIEGQGLSYLESQHDITTSGGNTYISIDGGHTTIELKGFTGLSSSDITTHK